MVVNKSNTQMLGWFDCNYKNYTIYSHFMNHGPMMVPKYIDRRQKRFICFAELIVQALSSLVLLIIGYMPFRDVVALPRMHLLKEL